MAFLPGNVLSSGRYPANDQALIVLFDSDHDAARNTCKACPYRAAEKRDDGHDGPNAAADVYPASSDGDGDGDLGTSSSRLRCRNTCGAQDSNNRCTARVDVRNSHMIQLSSHSHWIAWIRGSLPQSAACELLCLISSAFSWRFGQCVNLVSLLL